MQLTGQFQIEQWDEATKTTYDTGSKLNQAEIKQKYSGDIEGSSQVHYHLYYDSDVSSIFNGFEHLECEINGQKCTLVFQHKGQFKEGVASSHFDIIQAEGMTELKGKSGYFEAAMGGQAIYRIND